MQGSRACELLVEEHGFFMDVEYEPELIQSAA